MANYNQNLIFNGLGTLSITVPEAGPYFVEGHISLPTLTDGGGESALVVEISLNEDVIYTGDAGASGFRTTFTADALDEVSIDFSSSADADQVLNVIKSVISIGSGQ